MTNPWELPPIMTVDEVADFMRLGRTATYDAVRRGDLPSVRLGRKIRVPRDALLGLLGLPSGPPDTGPLTEGGDPHGAA